MSDEELLIKYQKYKIKRRKILLLILLLFLILFSVFFFSTNINKPKEKLKDATVNQVTIPKLLLTVSEIEIYEGEKISYIDYIAEASDKIDGNLIDKVKFIEIDTSNSGEYVIEYSIVNSSKIQNKAMLKVIVKEKPKKETNENDAEAPPITENKPSTNTNSSSITIPKEPSKPNPPASEFFLFTDGFTILNVTEACASVLKKSGRAGICVPLQDENGIYLGMRLDFY